MTAAAGHGSAATCRALFRPQDLGGAQPGPPAHPGHRALAKLTDTEIIDRLTSIRGVGQWTVEMLLIFTLGEAARVGWALPGPSAAWPGWPSRWRPSA